MEPVEEDKLIQRNMMSSEDRCLIHDGEMLSFYCRSHQALGCRKCMTLEHKNCLLGYIPDMIDTIDIDVEVKNFLQTLDDLKEKFYAVEKTSKERSQQVSLCYNDLQQDLAGLKDDLMKSLDDCAREVQETLASTKEDDENKMQELKTKCSEALFELKEITHKIEKMQEKGNFCQLYILIKKKLSKLDKYKNTVANLSKESRQNMKVQDCKIEASLGNQWINLTVRSEKADTETKSTPSQVCIKKSIMPVLKHIVIPLVIVVVLILLSRGAKFNKITIQHHDFENTLRQIFKQERRRWSGQCYYMNSDVVAVGHSTYLFNRISTKYVPIENKYEILSVIKENHHLLVLRKCRDGFQKLKLFEISDDVISEKISGEFKCSYVDMCHLANTLVLLKDSEVDILDSEWTFKHNIKFLPKGLHLVNIQPRPDGQAFYAIDQTEGRVMMFDLDGNSVRTYRNARLSSPTKLTVDSAGFVHIIGSGSYGIHQLTPSLELVNVIELNEQPISIDYNKQFNEINVGIEGKCKHLTIKSA